MNWKKTIAGVCLFAILPGAGVLHAGRAWRAASFQPSEKPVVQAGKGWIGYGDPSTKGLSNLSEGTWSMISVAYMRFNWSLLEPGEGEGRWQVLDDCIEACRRRGKSFAFRVMAANYFSAEQSTQATPLWVFNAGAQGTRSSVKMAMVPVWNDPVFLDKLGNFNRRLAARYDGHSNIAFVDLGSYGNWGENHLGVLSSFSTPLTSEEFLKLHARPFREQFRKSAVAVCSKWDDSRNIKFLNESPESAETVVKTLAQEGWMLRWDGAVSPMSAEKPLRHSVRGMPTVLEWLFVLSQTAAKSQWKSWLAKDLEEARPSYFSLGLFGKDGNQLIEEYPEVVGLGLSQLGWRFVIGERVSVSSNAITFEVRNVGVANCPPSYRFLSAWKDQHSEILSTSEVVVVLPTECEPGERKTISIGLVPPPGAESMSLGLSTGSLPLNADRLFDNTGDYKNGWLKVLELKEH